ncbi:MAG: hypothetical protein NUV47_02490 [Patescibacteria group bacterium]|nr:hypothetical protein [Patescibacteria group bacterium]
MSINKVEEMVETYLSGNISDFKKWLKTSATKQDIVDTIGTLVNHWWSGAEKDFIKVYLRAVDTVSRYLKG